MRLKIKSLPKIEVEYLLIGIIPFQYLLSENLFLMITMFLATLSGIISILKRRKLQITDFNIFYLALILYGIFSLLYTRDSVSTKVILIQIIPYYICCFVVSLYILGDYRYSYQRLLNMLKMFLISTIIICIISILNDIKEFNIYTRIGYKLFGNQYTMFTYYLMISICISIWLFYIEKSKLKKIVLVIVTLLLYTVSIFTAVRKAMAIPIIFLLSYVFIKSTNKKKLGVGILKIIILIILIVVAYSLLSQNEYFNSTAGRRIESFISGIKKSSGADNSFNVRVLLRTSAIECFKAYPFFGYGFGAFRDYADKMIGIRLYAHNNYVELLASTGVIGFSIYYLMIFSIIKKLVRYSKNNKNELLIFAVSFIISLLFNDFAIVSYLSLPYMMMLNILSCIYKKELCSSQNHIRRDIYYDDKKSMFIRKYEKCR